MRWREWVETELYRGGLTRRPGGTPSNEWRALTPEASAFARARLRDRDFEYVAQCSVLRYSPIAAIHDAEVPVVHLVGLYHVPVWAPAVAYVWTAVRHTPASFPRYIECLEDVEARVLATVYRLGGVEAVVEFARGARG